MRAELTEAEATEAMELLGVGDTEDETGQPPVREWPRLDQAALHGLAGRWVETVAPHTEADPVALLGQILTAYGSIIGRGSYATAEADRHHANLFTVLVGETSRGRKGTSEGHVRAICRAADEVWTDGRIHSGLSSGEGVIWAIRDPVLEMKPQKGKGETTYEEVMTDAGVDDKRILVIESEFASTLRVLQRDGNTLSAVIRDAWDGKPLETLTKQSRNRCQHPHVSIVGHITRDELLRYLDDTEKGNGFANRFLWLCVRRARFLPEGGNLDPAALQPLAAELRRAVDFGRRAGEIRRDDEARALWREIYADLSRGLRGLLGAMIARSEAQVLRLSTVYALLDCSPVVRREHLLAGLALWQYAEASARWIFRDATGDPVADRILEAVSETDYGLTRTEISGLLGRNMDACRIDQAIRTLIESGDVSRTRETDRPGRPTERIVRVNSSISFNSSARREK